MRSAKPCGAAAANWASPPRDGMDAASAHCAQASSLIYDWAEANLAARPFVETILSRGVRALDEEMRCIEILSPVEVREGLAEGDRVAVAANFLIDAESNLRAALRGLAAAAAPAPAPAGEERR